MDKYFFLFIIVVLTLLIVGPIWVAFVFGRESVCGSKSADECFVCWLSAAAGPLAIVAAAIAAWPVYDQLTDSRQATRLTLVTVLQILIQEKGGEMNALREENNRVESCKPTVDHLRHISDRIDLTSFSDFVDKCVAVGVELGSKIDKKTVLNERIEIAKTFDDLNSILEKVSNAEAAQDYSTLTQAASAAFKAIGRYERQYSDLDAALVTEQASFAADLQKTYRDYKMTTK